MASRNPRRAGALKVRRRDSAYVARGDSAMPLQVTRTEGSWVFDARGRKYLDFTAGVCGGNLGWGVPEIRDAIRSFSGPDYVVPSRLYAPWTELAQQLAQIAPGKLKRSFRATGGTEAVDIALQLAMACTGRGGFISIEESYHGNSIGTVSIGASEERRHFPNRLRSCHTVKAPLGDRALRQVERLLRTKRIAGLVMEPIVCNLGVVIPEARFMTEVAALCRKHGTLLILDEVMTGFGRTGTVFAAEHYGLEPDILCLAKALSGGYAPIGATLTTDAVYDAVEGEVSFYSTYGWHPLSVQAALASTRYFRRHQAALLKNVAERSRDFAQRLTAMRFPSAPEIRIKGLAVALEFEDVDCGEVGDRCREEGLLVDASDDTLLLLPPLNIAAAEVHHGLDILERCLHA